MFNEKHELAHDLPEHKDTIHNLKTGDAHFARLYDEYHDVTRQVSRIEQEIEPASDHATEELKKKRAALKDELYSMILKAVA